MPHRVLVFPGGTEIGLEINQALRGCKEVELFSAGQPGSNHAPYVFARHFELPPVSASGWLQALNELTAQQQISYIFPAHDDVIVALAQHRDELRVVPLCPSRETCELLRSKRATYRHLRDHLPTPRVVESPDAAVQFPLFAKPDRGQGSQGAQKLYDAPQLEALRPQWDEYIVTEYLPGEEFTIDCFSDRERGLLFCSGRTRTRVRNGISVATQRRADPRFAEYARVIAREIPIHGAWFFQLKQAADGTLTLLEAAPRIAGAMALHRVMGVNFPLLTLFEHLRLPLSIHSNGHDIVLDRALVNRYRVALDFEVLYVDFDDTIVLRDRVNPLAIRLIHQCVERGIDVILVTRHAGDLPAMLRRLRISELFDRIEHLCASESKADCIDPGRRAIFVDDSFRERAEVAARHGIPTFDPSMIESLIDDRA